VLPKYIQYVTKK